MTYLIRALQTLCLLLLGMQTNAQCVITPSNINFGNINPLTTTSATTTGSVNINCSSLSIGLGYRFCINIGMGSSSTSYNPRVLTSTPNTLNYNLFKNAGFSQIWGTGTQPVSGSSYQIDIVALLGLINQNVTMYASIPSITPTTPPGTYTSTFTAGGSNTTNYSATVLLSCGALLGTTVNNVTFNVTANISSSCSVAATPINFGSHTSLATSKTASGNLSVRCTNTTPYTISLNAGTTSGATVASRKLQGNSSTVSYQLYRDAGYTQAWGDGTLGTSTQSATGTGLSQPFTIYGRTDPQATPAGGSYTDSITVTITY